MDQDKVLEEDAELIEIERQSDKLETLYKKLEHYRRENMLFNSYLHREEEKLQGERLPIDDETVRRLVDQRVVLSIDEKYELASEEAEVLKTSVKDGKKNSDQLLETLRTVLDEADLAIIEIRKDASDFQREILSGNQNSRTGKIEAERIFKYRQMKLKQKDALIEKLITKKSTLNNQIDKIKAQLAKKQELGDDLKFIDFHQLQIENRKYLKELSEKNQKLLSLKVETGNIVRSWNEKKEELNEAIKVKNVAINNIKSSLDIIKQSEIQTQTYVEEYHKRNTEIATLDNNMNNKQSKGDEMTVNKYINSKNAERSMRADLKTLNRVIRVVKPEYLWTTYQMNKVRNPPKRQEVLPMDKFEEVAFQGGEGRTGGLIVINRRGLRLKTVDGQFGQGGCILIDEQKEEADSTRTRITVGRPFPLVEED